MRNVSQVSLSCCLVYRHPLVLGKSHFCSVAAHSLGNSMAQTSFSSCNRLQRCNSPKFTMKKQSIKLPQTIKTFLTTHNLILQDVFWVALDG